MTCAEQAEPHNSRRPDYSPNRLYACLNVATYGCDPGYKLVGTAAAVCMPEGEWNNPPPHCVETGESKVSSIRTLNRKAGLHEKVRKTLEIFVSNLHVLQRFFFHPEVKTDHALLLAWILECDT